MMQVAAAVATKDSTAAEFASNSIENGNLNDNLREQGLPDGMVLGVSMQVTIVKAS